MRLGLFSTLTGAGSRALVADVARACADGTIPDTDIVFLLVNRAPGEDEVTDASAAWLGDAFGLPLRRTSAAGFRRAERKAARASAESGDEGPLWAWRDALYEQSYRDLLEPTDLDLLLGDMWIWGAAACSERRALNLHPALPGGPVGAMWFDVLWDLVAQDAAQSGAMTHRVTTAVDLGPVASFCRYGLRTAALAPLWAELPPPGSERDALVAAERALKRGTTQPLFHALRGLGLERETPLVLETVRAVADGRLRLTADGVVDAFGRPLQGGLDLSAEVESRLEAAPVADGTR